MGRMKEVADELKILKVSESRVFKKLINSAKDVLSSIYYYMHIKQFYI